MNDAHRAEAHSSKRAQGATLSGWTASEVGLIVAGAIAVIAMAFTQTLSVPLVPVFAEQRGGDIAAASWVATSTLIASAVSGPIVGRVGDMYGKRRAAIACLSVVLVGAVGGTIVDSLGPMIVVRSLQGFGAGVIPLVFAMLRDGLASSRVIRGTSWVMVGGAGVGAGAGPTVAGLVLARWGVAGVFISNGVLVVVALLLVTRFTTTSSDRAAGSFDAVGALGLAVVLCAAMLGLSRGPAWGWSSRPVIAAFVVALVALVCWWRWERRARWPAVDLRINSTPSIRFCHFGGAAMGFATFAQYYFVFALVVVPAETGYGLGGTVGLAGLLQLPGVALMTVSVIVAGRLLSRWGSATVMKVGGALATCGFAVGALWHGSVVELILTIMIVDAGIGVMLCAMPVFVLQSVAIDATGAVNAVNALARQVGSVTASAVGPTLMSAGVVVDGAVRPAHWTFVTLYAIAAGLTLLVAVVPSPTGHRVRRRNPIQQIPLSTEVSKPCPTTST